jgi:hypothetical protein
MPIETAVALTAIVLAFTIFGAVLVWADVYTHRARKL